MIFGLGQHSVGETSIAVFREMKLMGLKPDGVASVSFVCL